MAVSKLQIIVEANTRQLDKLQGKVSKTEQGVQKLNASNKIVKSSLLGVGVGAKGAAVGVNALTASVKGLLGPIGVLLAGVSGLTAAFATLEAQNFAEAKVRSLGVNSKDLVKQLKAVSKELKGQASVVELTGAAYDVASAGFNNAADAAKVLKASSLGATGGFSDINTVANATTSVLNAYGLSADKAGRLVDGFIQTQNDGKIVIGEYARNIGKLAPIAASLKVPLEDINGAIAAVTANGVNAEIGITSLRSALAKLGANSKEGTELLAKYGVEINATTIGQEGLLKTLQKLSKVTDKTDLLKIIGTEAGQGIAPLLNNLGKLEQLIKNQGNVAGVAAKANAEASNTIRGAWKEVSTAFSNAFAEQSELATAIIPILQGVAEVINAINSPAGALVLQIGAVTAAVYALGAAITALKGLALAGWLVNQAALFKAFGTQIYFAAAAQGALTKATIALNAALSAGKVALFLAPLIGIGLVIQENIRKQREFEEALAGGADKIKIKINQLTKAQNEFKERLEAVKNGGYYKGQVSDIKQLQQEIIKYGKLIDEATRQRTLIIDIRPTQGEGIDWDKVNEYRREMRLEDLLNAPTSTPTGGGGGGGGAAPRESEVPQLTRALELSDKLLQIDKARLEAQFQGDSARIKELSELRVITELEGKRAEITAEEIPDEEKKLKIRKEENVAALQGLEIKYQALEVEKQRKEALEGILTPINDEIALLQGKLAGNEEEIRQLIEIRNLRKQIESQGGDGSKAEGLVKTRDALREQAEAADKLKESYKTLATGIASSLTGAFRSVVDGSKSAEEALADAFQGIADAFLDMAMKMIQEWLVMQALGIVTGGAGGGGGLGSIGGGSLGAGGGSMFGNTFSGFSGMSFAGGGYTGNDSRSGGVDGQGGFPAILHPQETVVDHFDAARGAMGGSGESSDAFSENADALAVSNSYTRERVMERENNERHTSSGTMLVETQVINNVEYVSKEQLEVATAASAKQARAQVFSDMRNKPSTRRQLGLNS